MRLEIDWTRCDGHGLCARLLPERITLDEHGFPVIADRHVDERLVPHARRAVAVCPQLALRLEQSPSKGPASTRPTSTRPASNKPAPSHTVR